MHLQQAAVYIMHTYLILLKVAHQELQMSTMVNYSNLTVTFNAGDAVDINIQRSLGSIGNYYAGDELLPLELSGLNPVIDLNEGHTAAQAMNVLQTLGNLAQFRADAAQIPLELTYGNNQLLNMNE